MKKILKNEFLRNFLLWCSLGLLCCFVGIINVNADTISNFSTKYYWCLATETTDNCHSTDYRSGSSNSVQLNGSEGYPPTYDTFESFAGFYNNIKYSVTKGSTYTIKFVLNFSNLASNEFGAVNLYRFSDFATTNNGTVSNVSTSYSRGVNCQSYAGTQYCNYKINVVYTYVPSSNASSFYIGSYNNSGYTLGVWKHYLTSIGNVDSVDISVNNDSTIINQNDTIINQNQTIIDQNQQTNEDLGDINDSINNSDTSGAQNSAGGFFNDFTTDTHGLTAIITAPLSLIESITSATCSPLVIPLPYVDKDLTLPCMGEIYSNYFGSFLSIYQLITFGIVAYWVCVRIFNFVKDFKNPDHDEIEVLDL